MAESRTTGAERAAAPDGVRARRRRADAEQNYARIVETAAQLLKEDPDAGLDAIAAAVSTMRA